MENIRILLQNEMHKDIEIINCGNGECSKIMGNWLLNKPGIAFVSVSLLEPSTRPVTYTYLDTIWIVVIGCVSLVLVSEIVSTLLNCRKNYVDNMRVMIYMVN